MELSLLRDRDRSRSWSRSRRYYYTLRPERKSLLTAAKCQIHQKPINQRHVGERVFISISFFAGCSLSAFFFLFLWFRFCCAVSGYTVTVGCIRVNTATTTTTTAQICGDDRSIVIVGQNRNAIGSGLSHREGDDAPFVTERAQHWRKRLKKDIRLLCRVPGMCVFVCL